jgi:hypothetical protein
LFSVAIPFGITLALKRLKFKKYGLTYIVLSISMMLATMLLYKYSTKTYFEDGMQASAFIIYSIILLLLTLVLQIASNQLLIHKNYKLGSAFLLIYLSIILLIVFKKSLL